MEDQLVIMVIEDDPLVQTVVEDALIEGGFDVAVAAFGEGAVALLRSGFVKFRALVTDINLPHYN